MGYFRFQRRIGIGPGLRLNIAKRSVSLSEGVPGAHVTLGKTPRVTLSKRRSRRNNADTPKDDMTPT